MSENITNAANISTSSLQPSSPTRILNFLGFMQRRFSDLMNPEGQENRPSALPINSRASRLTDSGPQGVQTSGARTSSGNRLNDLDDSPGSARLNDGDSNHAFSNLEQGNGNGNGYQVVPMQNESPLRRAGLLQPKSYNPSLVAPGSLSSLVHPHTHSQDTIRLATMELSNLPFHSSVVPSTSLNSHHQDFPNATTTTNGRRGDDGFIFPIASPSLTQTILEPEAEPHSRTSSPPPSSVLTESTASLPVSDSSIPESETGSVPQSTLSTLSSLDIPAPPPPSSSSPTHPEAPSIPQPHKRRHQKLSGLSLLRPLVDSSLSPPPSSASSPERTRNYGEETDSTPTPMGTPRPRPRALASAPTRQHDPQGVSRTPMTPEGLERERSDREVYERRRGRPEIPRNPQSYHVHWRDPSHSPVHSAASHSRSPPVAAWQSGQYETIEQLVSDERTPLLNHHTHSNGSAVGLYTSGGPPDSGIPPSYFSPNKCNGHIFGQESGTLVKHLKMLRHHVGITGMREGLRGVGERVKTLKEEVEPFSPRHFKTAVRSIPAVLLGCLLNILDGVSYGMILFPATGVFANLGPMGVSMFFVSSIVAQIVYTFGGSGFAGGNGSMMIEVVPFFHILATSIASQIGEDHPKEIIATTLVAYAFSSILTGLSFFLLGALKLGALVGFFPRHILVGCIGGVGAFLIETGLTVSMGIPDDDFTMTWETFRFVFLDTHNLVLWVLPLVLAILLRIITHKYHHQLIFPLYFLFIPLFFYIVVAAGRFDLGALRNEGWLFDIDATGNEHWYDFYSYLNFNAVRFGPLWSTLPTQFALLFFNVLHPPLNVPALAVSLDIDVDTDKELVGHGYSNLLSGLVGSVPNYLVYVNTLLFYRVGGSTRISGFLLAIATVGLLVIGTGPIAYLPVIVVGALIFVLGIDLVKEALWDTRHRVSKSEYITIISIMVCMTVWDFVIGVIFGIVVSCFFFVIQNSQRRSIRAIFTGDTAMSAVRRPSLQRAYIHEVARQTTVLRLQGFLFFGTITYVEETIRELVEGPSWQKNPVQFLVLDFTLVAGVDMSSAEALIRVQRLLSAKCVTLVYCGFKLDSSVGRALESVGILSADRVELFSTFNDAMEWTENAYLRAWYRSQKHETSAISFPVPGRQDADIQYVHPFGSFIRSPRQSHLRDAGDRTIATEIMQQREAPLAEEPLNTLTKAFSSYGTVDPHLFQPIYKYLERVELPSGFLLWKQKDPSDGLFILESGVLRASYKFDAAPNFEESMVAGTVAGELTALADCPRNTTVVVEHTAVLWKLSQSNLHRLQVEQPELSRAFLQLILKAAKIDYDILLGAIASRQ